MEDEYLKYFPKLKDDNQYKISSKQDYKYNCIAWAAIYDDRWLWPPGGYSLDGVDFFWPEEVKKDEKLETFIKLFENFGYSVCKSSELESNIRKIVLYQDEEGNCTHASRQRKNGLWTSKLGKEHDIIHESPFSVEGNDYGKVACFMKKKN